ncbi:MAG: PP2C family serine/threonine-protein phosphatase [Verrucomicrobiota bacterium]
MKIGRDFAGRQLLGSREAQEDSYAFSIISDRDGDVEKLLIVVADGLGGHTSGQEASQKAVEAFVEEFFQHAPRVDGNDAFALHESLMFANECIARSIDESQGSLEGMGTTLLAATVSRTCLQWISVGDSPLFLFRKGKLQRLNADHSMRPFIAQEIAEGRLAAEALTVHPQRNVIRSALLGEEIPLIDAPSAPFALDPHDVLLFASDGLQVLDEAAITARLAESQDQSAPQLIRNLLAAIEERNNPKQDNVTIAAVLAG